MGSGPGTAVEPSSADWTWRGLAELGRISNLPTCWSNVAVGFALAGTSYQPGVLLLVLLSISALYIGGMALNDVVDYAYDKQHRPHRPVPAGRVSIEMARTVSIGGLLVGVLLLAPLNPTALLSGLGLVAVIVAYNFLHKPWTAAVVLMGLCRGLVYIVAATAHGLGIDDPQLLMLAGGLTVYTVLVTLVARNEDKPDGGGQFWAMLLPLGLVAPWVFREMWSVVLFAAGIFPLLVILRGYLHLQPPARPIAAILTWLACISLLDAYFLVGLQRLELAGFALACFVLTAWSHRRILGT